jgi:hypothetical protein
MRLTLATVALAIGMSGAAHADCLHEIGQFREQVDAQNAAKPSTQSRAAARELQRLEQSEAADEIDCYNTLARARTMLAAPLPPAADDRYAKDQHRR